MKKLYVPKLERISLRRPHSPPILLYAAVPAICVIVAGVMLADIFIDTITIGGPSIIDLVFLAFGVGFVFSLRLMTKGRPFDGIKLGYFLYKGLSVLGFGLLLSVWVFPEFRVTNTMIYLSLWVLLLPVFVAQSEEILQAWREWE